MKIEYVNFLFHGIKIIKTLTMINRAWLWSPRGFTLAKSMVSRLKTSPVTLMFKMSDAGCDHREFAAVGFFDDFGVLD